MLTLTMTSVPARLFKPLPTIKEDQSFRPSPRKRRLNLPAMVNSQRARARLGTSKHLVLDAFAELIMYMIAPGYCKGKESQKDGGAFERVATAFRISPSGNRVHLVIAANGIAENHVQSFHRIWRILRAISCPNGKALESTIEKHYPRIVREVYTMCYDVTFKQIFEQWGERVLLHQDTKRPSSLGRQSTMDKLAKIFTCVEQCQHFFKSQSTGSRLEDITEDRWKGFALWMNELTSLSSEVCSVKSFCELWAELCDYHSPPPIRQAIENLTALHRAINLIFYFAMLPSQKIFASHLDIILVPLDRPSWRPSPSPSPISLDKKGLDATVVSDCDSNSNSRLASHCSKPTSKSKFKASHAHAPRALIEYLEYDRIYASAPPALSYIGLSHPCCSECEEWISVILPRCFVDMDPSVMCGHYTIRTAL